MPRKHQPGCPCCGPPDPPGCCAGETEPSFSFSGYTGGVAVWNSEYCCWQRTFTRDATTPVLSCCQQVSQHEIKIDCTTDLYQFERVNFVTTTSPGCPIPQSRCCLQAPVKIATFLSSDLSRQTNYFTADFYIDAITVIWGKEEMECPIGDPVECKWFIKLVFRCRYSASVNSSMYGETKLTNTFLHSCFSWLGSPVDTSFTNCTPTEACDQNPPGIFDACGDTQNVSSPSSCFEQGGEFCIQRIKFFDTRPTGSITFTPTDVIGDCLEPSCNSNCFGYDQEVCVSSPIAFDPPHWCTNPPTVSSTTTTYVMDQVQCGSVTLVDPVTCEGSAVVCVPPTTCTSPVSVSATCETLFYPTYPSDAGVCRFRTYTPGTQSYCLCLGPTEVFGAGPLQVVGRSTNVDCTTPSGCYTRLLCNGSVVACEFNFIGLQTASNDITVTIACGAYTQRTCCFQIPDFPITVSYPT